MESDHGTLTCGKSLHAIVLAPRTVLRRNARRFTVILASGNLCLLLVVGTEFTLAQELIFLDDFEDGNLRVGNPVRWGGGIAHNGTQQLSSSSNVLTSATSVESHLGWSMQTEASMDHHGVWVGVGIVFDEGNVWLGLAPSGTLALGFPGVIVAQELADLDTSSAMLRLDAFDDTLKAWAWKPGEWQPEEPTVSVETPLSPGRPGVWMQSGSRLAVAEFEFFEAATSPLPFNPTTGFQAGDADLDWDFEGRKRGQVQFIAS